MTSSSVKTVGRFELGPAQAQGGPGFYLGRIVDDELPPRVLLRVALSGEAPALALEGAGRMKMLTLLRGKDRAFTAVPELIRRGSDRTPSGLAFAAVAAVKLDTFIEADPLPVPISLAFAA